MQEQLAQLLSVALLAPIVRALSASVWGASAFQSGRSYFPTQMDGYLHFKKVLLDISYGPPPEKEVVIHFVIEELPRPEEIWTPIYNVRSAISIVVDEGHPIVKFLKDTGEPKRVFSAVPNRYELDVKGNLYLDARRGRMPRHLDEHTSIRYGELEVRIGGDFAVMLEDYLERGR